MAAVHFDGDGVHFFRAVVFHFRRTHALPPGHDAVIGLAFPRGLGQRLARAFDAQRPLGGGHQLRFRRRQLPGEVAGHRFQRQIDVGVGTESGRARGGRIAGARRATLLRYTGCERMSLNWSTKAYSPGPGLARIGSARSTSTSLTSVPSTAMVSAMNSCNGMARGSSLLSSKSVCTQGGASSSTLTEVFFSFQRSDIVYECSAALVDE